MYKLEKAIKNVIKYSYLSKKSEENIVHIGYGIDDNYARCTGTSIVSFCVNNPKQNFRFYILASDLSNISKERFEILAKQYLIDIIIYEIDASFFSKLPTKMRFPLPAYFRFILPLVLKDLDRVFYIDGDIICVNNAKELFDTDFENNIIIAVPDNKETNDKRNKELGLKNHIYFNSGVLGININKWNELNVFDKLVKKIVKEPEKFLLPDQDALNVILSGGVKYLPRKFNWFNVCYELKFNSISNEEIVLLHFTCLPKPWDLGWSICPICNEYNVDLYNNYEKMTPWANLPPSMPSLHQYTRIRVYSQDLRRHGDYLKSFNWYIKYLLTKMKYLIRK